MLATVKRSGMGALLMVGLAPLLPAMEPQIIAAGTAQRRCVIFEQMARQQKDWSADRIAELCKAYREGTLKPVTRTLARELKKEVRRAGLPSSPPGGAEVFTQDTPGQMETQPAP